LTNPWDNSQDEIKKYLTYSRKSADTHEIPSMLFITEIKLDDTKTIRSRTVYDLITFFSEVSGFADIFFVLLTFLFGLLYTPYVLEAALHEHMGRCITVKKKRKASAQPKTDSKGIYEILSEVRSRFAFKLNIWIILGSKLLPKRWRSDHAEKLFAFVEKS
jgi:hypothetical protein